jgi:glycosyltransferase involved in cell wall biosynthesis
MLTILIPVFNESRTLRELHAGLVASVAKLDETTEILFVDDGSDDGSQEIVRELCRSHDRTRGLVLARNQGKAAALDLGFRHARGDIVVTLDADLQDDPEEIPRFIEKIDEGYDLVSGWKVERKDPWHKTAPSRVFNAVVRCTTGLKIHDINCGFKAYSRRALENLRLYGELHRYVAVFVAHAGGRITEIEVLHHARRHGRSKYGLRRLPKGLFDLMTVLFTTRYLRRPMHFFGSLGLASSGLGGVALAYLAVLWLLGERPIGTRPLLFYGLLLVIVGVQLFSLGLLGELVNRLGRRGAPNVMVERVGFGGGE